MTRKCPRVYSEPTVSLTKIFPWPQCCIQPTCVLSPLAPQSVPRYLTSAPHKPLVDLTGAGTPLHPRQPVASDDRLAQATRPVCNQQGADTQEESIWKVSDCPRRKSEFTRQISTCSVHRKGPKGPNYIILYNNLSNSDDPHSQLATHKNSKLTAGTSPGQAHCQQQKHRLQGRAQKPRVRIHKGLSPHSAARWENKGFCSLSTQQPHTMTAVSHSLTHTH